MKNSHELEDSGISFWNKNNIYKAGAAIHIFSKKISLAKYFEKIMDCEGRNTFNKTFGFLHLNVN